MWILKLSSAETCLHLADAEQFFFSACVCIKSTIFGKGEVHINDTYLHLYTYCIKRGSETPSKSLVFKKLELGNKMLGECRKGSLFLELAEM